MAVWACVPLRGRVEAHAEVGNCLSEMQSRVSLNPLTLLRKPEPVVLLQVTPVLPRERAFPVWLSANKYI